MHAPRKYYYINCVVQMNIKYLNLTGRRFVIGKSNFLRSTKHLNLHFAIIGDIGEPMLSFYTQSKEISSDQDAINLPPLLFNNDMISGLNSTGLLFCLYDSSTLFPVNTGNNLNSDGSIKTIVGSRIIVATVTVTVDTDLQLRNLEEGNITVILQLLNPEQNVSLEDWLHVALIL